MGGKEAGLVPNFTLARILLAESQLLPLSYPLYGTRHAAKYVDAAGAGARATVAAESPDSAGSDA
jgi:hypothetical protein